MMTAELEAEPSQATLDGLPDVQAPAHTAEAGEAFRFVAAGPLLATVYVHTTSRSAVQLVALLRQQVPHHPQAMPLLAVQTLEPLPGEGYAPTYDRARALAAPLGKGEHVLVVGHGVELGQHQGAQVLKVINCEAVRPFTPLPEPGGTTTGSHREC
jgi:hypothetical protein